MRVNNNSIYDILQDLPVGALNNNDAWNINYVSFAKNTVNESEIL